MSYDHKRAAVAARSASRPPPHSHPRYISNADRAEKLGLNTDARREGSPSNSVIPLLVDELVERLFQGHTNCGPQDDALLDILVPDQGPITGTDYSDACATHDDCYASQILPKEVCDFGLGLDVLRTCLDSGQDAGACFVEGGGYAAGVLGFGDEAWSQSAEAARAPQPGAPGARMPGER